MENWLFRPKKAKHLESKVQTMRAKNTELKMKTCGVRKLQSNIGEMDRAELLRLFDIAAQVRRMPFEVIQGAVNYDLAFAYQGFPSEVTSKKEPPISLTDRSESIVIDGTLGLYDPSKRKITVFQKGIKRAAKILRARPEDLLQIVRLHEWSHALLHLGLEEAEYKSVLQNNSLWTDQLARLDSWFNALEPNLHETLAQLLTRESLRLLRDQATIPEAQASLDRIQELFKLLMRCAPSRYRIDKFDNTTKSRILGSIRLLRNGGLVGADAWETVARW